MPLFFNADHLPPLESEYVAWVDVMGTQSSMSRSINATANFIFKLHTAALQAPLAYAADRIKAHQEMVQQYFGFWEPS